MLGIPSTICDLNRVLYAFWFVLHGPPLDVVEHAHEDDPSLKTPMERALCLPQFSWSLEESSWWYVPDKFANRTVPDDL